ncbi:cytochrome b/b6 domain-containing protein [Rhizobium binae]|uniref:cytochrome b/b6 domain-containing protein n=1 Tax=Rhizobium binae TaxID=1138190 RepID=UPI001441A231|nr:cytochrome b/b6 domain-containing protein [Rhizobium binae]NKL51305.1 cytochrome B [Rhizobium leguminosarum bv. viciae]MBX4927618.1 cytochrome B [Rhizobium binae]MBX4937687.1 cytochrome B [Rhizobium binae]MBX4944206.1 cytochrome B [Rhizobium binae]MBX4952305.1 cytochrome B [Rhizobium binae]
MTAISSRQEGILPSDTTPKSVKVWDPIVRIFHWTIVTACTLNLFILEEGKYWHRMTGYVVGVAIAIRLVWGFIGTKHARFTDFWPTPRRVRDHITSIIDRKENRYLGHNPLASVMMLLLVALLAATALTGWMTTWDAFWGEKWLEQLHGTIANSIMVLVFIHAGAAVLESWRHRENLIWAMVTGRKNA